MPENPYQPGASVAADAAVPPRISTLRVWVIPVLVGALVPPAVLASLLATAGYGVMSLLIQPMLFLVSLVSASIATLGLRPFPRLHWALRTVAAAAMATVLFFVVSVILINYVVKNPIEIRLPDAHLPAP